MNPRNIIKSALCAAMLFGILFGISFANSPSWSATSPGGTYYAVVGSSVKGASTIYFVVTISNVNPHPAGVYYDSLILIGNQNHMVNEGTIPYSSGQFQTNIQLPYTFTNTGRYYLYSSIKDSKGDVSNTSVDTVIVLQGLIASMIPQSQNPKVGQSDALSVNLTDNFLLLPNNGEPSTQYYIFKVVQTAPDGTQTIIATNKAGGQGIASGQPYYGGYLIPTPRFMESGTYSYTIYATSTAAGTNASATATIQVVASPTATTTSTTSTTTTTTTTTSICEICSTTPTTTSTTTTTSLQTTTVAPSSSGSGYCGLCISGSGGGLPASTSTTTVPLVTIPSTSSVPPSKANSSGKGQMNVTVGEKGHSSGAVSASSTTSLLLVITILLIVILALVMYGGKRNGNGNATAVYRAQKEEPKEDLGQEEEQMPIASPTQKKAPKRQKPQEKGQAEE